MYEHKLAEAIKEFGDFWEQYRSDIVLRVESVLTEPVCPVAIVEFELDRAPFKRISCCAADTIDEAIKLAIDDAIVRLSQFKGMNYPEIKAKIDKENEELRIQREAEALAIRELYQRIKNTPEEFDIAELLDEQGNE